MLQEEDRFSSELQVHPQAAPPLDHTRKTCGRPHTRCPQVPAPRREYEELLEATRAQGRDG